MYMHLETMQSKDLQDLSGIAV